MTVHTEHAPARIKSFSRRGGRMARRFDEVMEQHAAEYVIALPAGATATTIPDGTAVDIPAAFGRNAPLIVEIGPGSGEQLVSFAATHRDIDVLGVEAWHPGVARCVAHAVKGDVHNLRIVEGDAAQLLPVLFGLAIGENGLRGSSEIDDRHPNSGNPRAAEVWTFFPDPWRKARHHKRRLVTESFAQIVAGVLAPGGVWRLATDWDDYAWQMRSVVETAPGLENPYRGQRPDANDPEGQRGGFAPRWEGRVMTRFEKRGIAEGRTIHDVVARRSHG
ncbi:MAG: tRNA (guanosine(46)-N(7))-methyltransferase TrmB [Ancrocorticia sp.]|jgi:tRNA (guanine-N7-)-methyltransferase|nr:tRNA (guanosine(46)-N(7))-methyltransferase TrmB [Ancrocorticia sp.]MCI2002708.1 tRNA (guanosine(46)-N(7))-methyltransferase TrmB [Ancrocorticia sp.]MCI2012545.1 tRNA (guanosine(46)-N(7))-methyltransferase TrmB [Ancrocorticia sp.]MCI2029105.1 tRNA (guanosine(46)-N(7))-methyltransferase TrmB [Ancrocorticia sp.]